VKPELFNKLKNSGDSGAGYDLVGNIVVGLGLVWIARKIWPELSVKAYGFGVVLGAVSGFYQLFKSQQRESQKKKDDATQRPE
jgi:hypothetical protein